MRKTAEHGQYFTPAWVPEIILEKFYPGLGSGDVVSDPACGDGRFLKALPASVRAFGVEIDAAVAEAARANTGRQIITADFITAALPLQPSLFIGNPPFKTATIDAFLSRCFDVLEEGGQVGFILPAYYFQAPYSVVREAARWSIAQDMLPRSLFQDLKYPINFVRFTKEQQRTLVGFFLYSETHALASLKLEYRRMFKGNKSRANVWLETLFMAVKKCGGRASLEQIYKRIEGKRPTPNPWWREKIRQLAGQFLVRISPGVFELPEAFA